MDYHGILMKGNFETDNINAKDANGVKMYDDSSMLTFQVKDGGYIQAYQGTSINEFSIDETLAGNSDDALVTEKAIKTFVDSGFQPLDSDLTAISALTPTDSNFIVGNGSAWITESGATARASLGLGSAAIRDAEDTLTDGGNLPDGAAIKAYSDDRYLNENSNLSDLSNASTARTNLGVAIGSDVQAWDSDLDTIAALTPTDGNFIVGSGANWVTENDATARASLGLTGNNNTTHYHDTRYYQQTEFGDGTTIAANIKRIKVNEELTSVQIAGGGYAGYMYAGTTDPASTTRLNYDGYFYATKTFNAVYSDVADFRQLNGELVHGRCYKDSKEGASLCNDECQMGSIGIATDTYGMSCGFQTNEDQVPIAVAGWVLAYVDKEYKVGTPLTNDSEGGLREMLLEERRDYPERLVATYSYKEAGNEWNSVKVNERHWVKVK